jgi:hypothetical protein
VNLGSDPLLKEGSRVQKSALALLVVVVRVVVSGLVKGLKSMAISSFWGLGERVLNEKRKAC